jgi:hypothetical protein
MRRKKAGVDAIDESSQDQAPVKDENASHPVASAWRAALRAVVQAFVQGDYTLARGIPSVEPVVSATAKRIRGYIASYGETLADLPDDTWRTSVSQWMGDHWEVLVDLWTRESGASDLVLSARVFETHEGFRIEVDSVYVP